MSDFRSSRQSNDGMSLIACEHCRRAASDSSDRYAAFSGNGKNNASARRLRFSFGLVRGPANANKREQNRKLNL